MGENDTSAGPSTACPVTSVEGQLYVKEPDGHWREVVQDDLFAAADRAKPGITGASR